MTTSYQNLTVWQKSMDLVEEIYILVRKFPKTEIFALIDQLKRSSVSIASNIAEGSQRGTKKENLHFLFIAKGSAAELETQLLISKRLSFLSEGDFQTVHEHVVEVLKMLSSYISYHKTHI